MIKTLEIASGSGNEKVSKPAIFQNPKELDKLLPEYPGLATEYLTMYSTSLKYNSLRFQGLDEKLYHKSLLSRPLEVTLFLNQDNHRTFKSVRCRIKCTTTLTDQQQSIGLPRHGTYSTMKMQ